MTGEVQCDECGRDKRSTRKVDDRWVCTDCQPHRNVIGERK